MARAHQGKRVQATVTHTWAVTNEQFMQIYPPPPVVPPPPEPDPAAEQQPKEE